MENQLSRRMPNEISAVTRYGKHVATTNLLEYLLFTVLGISQMDKVYKVY